MSDLIQKIDWAIDTIRYKERFGLDDLNASLARERRAKGVLIDCKKQLSDLQEKYDRAVEVVSFYADANGENWGACRDNDTYETCCHMISENSGGKRAREFLAKLSKED